MKEIRVVDVRPDAERLVCPVCDRRNKHPVLEGGCDRCGAFGYGTRIAEDVRDVLADARFREAKATVKSAFLAMRIVEDYVRPVFCPDCGRHRTVLVDFDAVRSPSIAHVRCGECNARADGAAE